MTAFQDQSPKVQIITMAVLALVLAGAIEYAVLMPMQAANAATAVKLAKVTQENLNLRPWNGRMYLLQVQNRQLQQRWLQAQTRLPESASPDEFLHQLQAAARDSGISIRKVSAESAPPQSLYLEDAFSLQIDGSFSGVLNFFDRVRALPRIVSVRHWTLKSLHGEAGTLSDYSYRPDETVTATCDVSTYYSPAGGPLAAATPGPSAKTPAAGRGGKS